MNNYLRYLNIPKTIYVNFRLLPFKQAIHMPILLYGKVNISGCTGQVVIKRMIHFGMLRFGISRGGFYGTTASVYSRFCVKGTLILDEREQIGGGIKRTQFSHNSCLNVGEYGTLVLNEYEEFGPRCSIACFDRIEIGSWLSTSWDVQIFDTNFHYLINKENLVKRATNPVYIGNHCWLGNRVTLNAGATISDYSVVASNSLVNKRHNDSYSVIAGIPAKTLATGWKRIFSFQLEDKLNYYFANHKVKETIITEDIVF